MHFKNGTPAKTGDSIITKRWNGQIIAGTIHALNAGASTCNATLATPIVGGVQQESVTLGECYSAEDAFAAMEAKQPAERVA